MNITVCVYKGVCMFYFKTVLIVKLYRADMVYEYEKGC